MKEFVVDLGIYGAKLVVIAEKNTGAKATESCLPGCQSGWFKLSSNVIFITSENDAKWRLYKGGLVKMGRWRNVKDDGYNNRRL
jgi:hypothetical protein